MDGKALVRFLDTSTPKTSFLFNFWHDGTAKTAKWIWASLSTYQVSNFHYFMISQLLHQGSLPAPSLWTYTESVFSILPVCTSSLSLWSGKTLVTRCFDKFSEDLTGTSPCSPSSISQLGHLAGSDGFRFGLPRPRLEQNGLVYYKLRRLESCPILQRYLILLSRGKRHSLIRMCIALWIFWSKLACQQTTSDLETWEYGAMRILLLKRRIIFRLLESSKFGYRERSLVCLARVMCWPHSIILKVTLLTLDIMYRLQSNHIF